MLRKRNKDEDALNTASVLHVLQVETKRLKMSKTPGEIALARDVGDMAGAAGLIISINDENSREAYIEFVAQCGIQICCPCRFSVLVPSYYPHNVPVVVCQDEAFVEAWSHSSDYVDSKGIVQHPLFHQINWTALCSLKDIVIALSEIRTAMHLCSGPSCVSVASSLAPSPVANLIIAEHQEDDITSELMNEDTTSVVNGNMCHNCSGFIVGEDDQIMEI